MAGKGWPKGKLRGPMSQIHKDRISAANKGNSKLSAAMTGKVLSEETKIKLSIAQKAWCLTPEGIKHMSSLVQKTTNTKPHLVLQAAITAAGFSFDTEHFFPPYRVDCFIESANLALEADGKRWHNKKKDAVRDAYILKRYGVYTIRFPEDMLMKKSNWLEIINVITLAVITIAEGEI